MDLRKDREGVSVHYYVAGIAIFLAYLIFTGMDHLDI